MNASERKDKLQKIKNLLDLSKNNSNESEAIAAALKAQELMVKYNVEDYEICEKEKEKIGQSYVIVGTGRKWKRKLSILIADNYRCKTYLYGSDCVVFYGYESDVKIAKQVFNYLFKTGNRLGDAYVRKIKNQYRSTRGIFNSYIIGFLEGLRERLEKQCVALMIVVPPEVEKEYKIYSEGFGTYKVGLRGTNSNAMKDGKFDAHNVIDGKSLGNESNNTQITAK